MNYSFLFQVDDDDNVFGFGFDPYYLRVVPIWFFTQSIFLVVLLTETLERTN